MLQDLKMAFQNEDSISNTISFLKTDSDSDFG